jgi:signal peptidase
VKAMVIDKYHELKLKNPEAIFFFKFGDYLVALNDDAIKVKGCLGFDTVIINENEQRCLIPYHKHDRYEAQMQKQGVKYQIVNVEREDFIILPPKNVMKKDDVGPKTKASNKHVFTLKYIMSVIIIGIIVFLGYLFLPFKTFVIITPSMEPVINVNDFVIINRYYPSDNLQEDDIIAFLVDFNNSGTKDVVIHYLYSIQTNIDGSTTILTRAEGETTPDPWEIDGEDYLGRYLGRIPRIGGFIRFMQSPIGIGVIIIDIVLIYLIIYHVKYEKNDMHKNQEEDTGHCL